METLKVNVENLYGDTPIQFMMIQVLLKLKKNTFQKKELKEDYLKMLTKI